MLTEAEKTRLAQKVVDEWCGFQIALSLKGRYPREKFDAFLRAARQFAEATRADRLVHRDVAAIIHGLGEQLRLERKRAPGPVLYEADRLECLFFAGYDPHLEGDEPPDY